jgi:hypothetical protein
MTIPLCAYPGCETRTEAKLLDTPLCAEHLPDARHRCTEALNIHLASAAAVQQFSFKKKAKP